MQHNLIIELIKIVSTENVISQNIPPEYCQDWRKNFTGYPLALVFPKNVQQISEIVKACNKYNISIITQGGNTSLCGGSVTDKSRTQVLVNLKYLNKIKNINVSNSSISVEAGCTLEQVQNTAIKHNMLYPLSLPSEKWCTIGGNLSTNAGGVAVLKYGNSRQLCLGLEVVMADGSIYNSSHHLYKNNMGYDLKQMFIGAEGTLGIITSASLRLYPLPQKYYAVWIGIDNFEQAINLFKYIQRHYAHAISSFEIMNKTSIECVASVFKDKIEIIDSNNNLEKYEWHVLLELEEHGEVIGGNLKQKLQKVADNLIYIEEYALHISDNNKSKLWDIRHSIPLAQKELGGNIKHDISLNLENIADFVKNIPKKLLNIDPKAKFVVFGHIGDGNLHYNVSSELKYKHKIQDCIYNAVLASGGSIAAEHGIGRLKPMILRSSITDIEYNLAKNIKQCLDPKNILNPHIIFNETL
ncbi:MAG: hypothetical protein RLZZ210_822 [Pseudomonadota bacterium]